MTFSSQKHTTYMLLADVDAARDTQKLPPQKNIMSHPVNVPIFQSAMVLTMYQRWWQNVLEYR